MKPANAKYFDQDTGQPLTGANSLSISEVFPNLGKGVFVVVIIPGWIYGLATSNLLVLLAVSTLWLVGFVVYGMATGQAKMDEGFPATFGGSGGIEGHGGISLFDHYDSGCDDPSNPGSGCYMDDDKP